MAEKSVAQKLRIKPGSSVWVLSDEDLARLGPLPTGVNRAAAPGEADAIVLFAADQASLRSALASHGAEVARAKLIWVAYPKGGRSDMNRDSLWPIVAALGLRPIGQVAVDETWSALRFRPLEPGEPQFTGGR